MPFGISLAPPFFVQIGNDLFLERLYKDILVYLDDIICFSETFEEYLNVLEWVFDKLLQAKLKLKAPKCKFAYNKVKYLGHIILEDGVSVDPAKMYAILHYPPPKNAKLVKQNFRQF